MGLFRLKLPFVLHPLWTAQYSAGRHDAVVNADGTVTLGSETLDFNGEGPTPGTPIEVWANASGWFVCATKQDLLGESRARQVEEATRKEELRLRRNLARDEANMFNAQMRLPVQWTVGIKDVLTGLSEHSHGDGRNKATVEHIMLLEALHEGRLRREPGDFLCSSSNAENGRRYSASPAESRIDGDGDAYLPMVTCKSCLGQAKRWICHDEATPSATIKPKVK